MPSSEPSLSVFAVLVVEDQPIILLDTMDMVSDAGFVVFGASSAAQAIGMLEDHSEIRILFTNVRQLGSMSGLELAHVVRQRWPPVTIMMTSVLQALRPDDVPQGSMFFRKPYSKTVVVKAMFDTFASQAS